MTNRITQPLWDDTMLRQVRPQEPLPSDPRMTKRDVSSVIETIRKIKLLPQEGTMIELYPIEVVALRWLSGDEQGLPPGAWLNACIGRLKRLGYLDLEEGITEKGKELLESLS